MRKLKFRFWLNKKLQGILELKENNIMDMGWEWDKVDQFTGLFDKQGKEIYEGDILLPVEMHDSNIEFYRNGKGVPIVIEFKYQSFNVPCDIGNWEVIGNVYENPELLEAK